LLIRKRAKPYSFFRNIFLPQLAEYQKVSNPKTLQGNMRGAKKTTSLTSKFTYTIIYNYHTKSNKMRFQKIYEHVAKIKFPDGWVIRLHENDLKILLGYFSAKVGRENIFKPTIGNDTLQQDSNDNVV